MKRFLAALVCAPGRVTWRISCMSGRRRRSVAALIAAVAALVSPQAFSALPEAGAGHIRLCVDPDWAPYEWLDEEGRHHGIAADLLRLIASRAGLQLEVVRTSTWDESLSVARTGGCDALSFLNETPERLTWLSFSAPYFLDRNVIITRAERPDVASLAELPPKTTIALPTATSIIERVGRDFPHLRILPVASEAEAFSMVEAREADLTLRGLMVAAHTIRAEGWFNLRIAGQLPQYANNMRIGVVGERPELLRTLDGAIATLRPDEVDEIVNRHVGIDVNTPGNHRLAAQVGGGLLLLLGLAYLWIRHLARLNRRLADLSKQLAGDIEARARAEQALKQSEEQYRSLVEMAQEGILVVQSRRVAYCNPAFLELVGYTADELAEMDAFSSLIVAEDLPRALSNHARRLSGGDAEQRYPLRLVHKSGRTLWAETSGVPIMWNNAPATLNVVNDITARKLAEARIQHLAEHDPLTGLPNRAALDHRLEHAVAAAAGTGQALALLFIDLDGFKPVNDTYGHAVGDLLLQEVASRLRDTLRQADTAARIGGDEFVVLLPAVTSAEDAARIAEKLRAALARVFTLGSRQVTISASVGVAIYPEDGATPDELMQHADASMYGEKQGWRPACSP